jgi:hypothetical protein
MKLLLSQLICVCLGLLLGCVLALRYLNPTMTETQLFLSFWREYALMVAGVFLAWFGLRRTL